MCKESKTKKPLDQKLFFFQITETPNSSLTCFSVYEVVILSLHVFNRYDSTRAFKGIGKVKLISILQKRPLFLQIFPAFG